MQLHTGWMALLTSAVLLNACASSEIGESKDVNQDKIYQAYAITKTAGMDEVEVRAEFRFAGKMGTTLVLSQPEQVKANGQRMAVDSNDASGAWYSIAVKEMNGKINLTYTDVQNKAYQQEIATPALWVTAPPAATRTADLCLPFDGMRLGTDDYIDISSGNTDSTFSITYTGEDGKNCMTIPAAYLQKQKEKTLQLQISVYKKIALSQGTAEGGIILYQYHCKPIEITLLDEPVQAQVSPATIQRLL
jgi:hypothetical protein